MREKLGENPLLGMFLGLSTGSVVQMGARVKSEEELNSALEEKLGPFAGIITSILSNIGNEIEVNLAHPLLGVHVDLRGEGLGDLVKTAAKFVPLP